MTDVEKIVAGLTEAQRAYINAVHDCDGEYHARHGVTCNWALRHGIVDTAIHLPSGRTEMFHAFPKPITVRFEFGGQVLTLLGRLIHTALQEQSNEGRPCEPVEERG